MIKISINYEKIDETRLFKGKSGSYLNCVLVEHQDSYGNDGFVSQDISKEERLAGMKGSIIGNWRHIGVKPKQPKQYSDEPTS